MITTETESVNPLSPLMKIHNFSPYCSPYISYGTSRENLSKRKNILSLVNTSFILITCMYKQASSDDVKRNFIFVTVRAAFLLLWQLTVLHCVKSKSPHAFAASDSSPCVKINLLSPTMHCIITKTKFTSNF